MQHSHYSKIPSHLHVPPTIMKKMLHKGMTDTRPHLSLGYGASVSIAKATNSVNDKLFNFLL